MRCLSLSKLIILTVLIIFNQIILSNCRLYFNIETTFIIEDKVYCLGVVNFFYVDLAGISLDTDELVEESKWIDLTNIKPKPDNLAFRGPIPGGNKIMFLEGFAGNLYLNIFDTTLKKWNINQNVKILQPVKHSGPERWIFDEKTGKSYLLPEFFDENVIIFDTINMEIYNSASSPLILSNNPSKASLSRYNKYAQVLVPNGQILFIGGQINKGNVLMNSSLIYDTINDTWQIVNITGKTPEARIDHTAVSTSDGRVIVFGGVSKPSVPALPHLSVLDTSKIPYEWSTPVVENPIGALSGHTSLMVKNYMISAFGRNESNNDPLIRSNIDDFYKLNVTDPLKYKWSLLAKFIYDDNTVKNTPTRFGGNNSFAPIQTEVSAAASSSFYGDVSRTRVAIIVLFVIIVVICISFIFYYKKKQINKKSSSNETEENLA